LYSNTEVEAEELAGPLVLGNRRQLLIKQEFEAKMVNADEKRVAPEVGTPMADCEHQFDELLLICCELGVPRRNLLAVERHGPHALMEYGAEARAERVALDDEFTVKVWQLQHQGSRQCVLQGAEGHLGVIAPPESLLPQ
jgi:hypothetical protein